MLLGKTLLLFFLFSGLGVAQSLQRESAGQGASDRRVLFEEPRVSQTLPDAPDMAHLLEPSLLAHAGIDNFGSEEAARAAEPVAIYTDDTPPDEPFHWKGLLLQSLSFDLLQNATRIMTADQNDRHLLLNKPFWSDYWASLGQFNMRRWNDGDSIAVNYIGHPMQGAIAGYLEVQNDPRGRKLRISRDSRYWKSRLRAGLWNLTYSTQWEIGPLGETAIFNQGGFTYPIRCEKHGGPGTPCTSPQATYTNNTGWVDFIITPVVGTLWLLGEDTIDRYISDPLVENHPNTFGYKVLRSSLNPPRSLANMLRGHYPWWRDYEHPGVDRSTMIGYFNRAMDLEPHDHGEIFLHYSNLGLRTNHVSCMGCMTSTSGVGVEGAWMARRYLDMVADISVQPNASPLSSLNVGGTMTAVNFGLRSGYSGQHFALKVSLAPGFVSYSRAGSDSTADDPNPPVKRNYNFSAVAAIAGDIRISKRLALRATVQQMLIRYRSPDRDPPGIGSPPRLSFLSHDNYINSTNWGMEIGPVLRF